MGQEVITNGTNYSQDFNGVGTSLPSNWSVAYGFDKFCVRLNGYIHNDRN